MVEDLLVVPDIEGEKIRINAEPIWVNKIIESAVTLVNTDNRDFVNHTSDDFPLIMADKDRFEQVLVNLFENALKYAYEDSAIEIDSIVEGNFAKIYIKNKCDAIPEYKLVKLFEKFTRIDDQTTRTTRGTGLGLFIVKGLVEAMKGEIKLYSNAQEGFVVEVKMPIYQPNENLNA